MADYARPGPLPAQAASLARRAAPKLSDGDKKSWEEMEIASRAGIPLGQRPSTAALQACSRLAGRIPEGVRRNVLAVLHHIAQRPGLPGPLLQPAASAAASLLINGEEEGLISSSLTVLESVAELLPGSSRPAEEVVRQGLLRAFARSVEGGAERQSLTERVEMCCDCLLFRSSMLHGYSQAARGATTQVRGATVTCLPFTFSLSLSLHSMPEVGLALIYLSSQSVQASVLSEIKEAVLEGWPKIASWWLERYSSVRYNISTPTPASADAAIDWLLLLLLSVCQGYSPSLWGAGMRKEFHHP